MRPAERLALRQRFAFRCGYCGVSEAETGAELITVIGFLAAFALTKMGE